MSSELEHFSILCPSNPFYIVYEIFSSHTSISSRKRFLLLTQRLICPIYTHRLIADIWPRLSTLQDIIIRYLRYTKKVPSSRNDERNSFFAALLFLLSTFGFGSWAAYTMSSIWFLLCNVCWCSRFQSRALRGTSHIFRQRMREKSYLFWWYFFCRTCF